jgi:exonuclease VII small subunit
LDYLTTHTSQSPIRRGFVPCFVNYKKGCTRLAAASDKVNQLLAHNTVESCYVKLGKVNSKFRFKLSAFQLNLLLLSQISMCRNFGYLKKGCTRLAAASDKVNQLLAHGRWFSPGTPASSTTKIGRHDITH